MMYALCYNYKLNNEYRLFEAYLGLLYKLSRFNLLKLTVLIKNT